MKIPVQTILDIYHFAQWDGSRTERLDVGADMKPGLGARFAHPRLNFTVDYHLDTRNKLGYARIDLWNEHWRVTTGRRAFDPFHCQNLVTVKGDIERAESDLIHAMMLLPGRVAKLPQPA